MAIKNVTNLLNLFATAAAPSPRGYLSLELKTRCITYTCAGRVDTEALTCTTVARFEAWECAALACNSMRY